MTVPSPSRRLPNPVGVAPSLRRWYDRAFTWDRAPPRSATRSDSV